MYVKCMWHFCFNRFIGISNVLKFLIYWNFQNSGLLEFLKYVNFFMTPLHFPHVRIIGILNYWNFCSIKILIYWNFNVLKCPNISKLPAHHNYQNSDILEFGCIRILTYHNFIHIEISNILQFQCIEISDILGFPIYQNFWHTGIIIILTCQNFQYIDISYILAVLLVAHQVNIVMVDFEYAMKWDNTIGFLYFLHLLTRPFTLCCPHVGS